MNKEKVYQKAIIRSLLEEGTTTASVIAKNVNLSERSVRNYIDKINDFMIEKELGYIVKKRGTGMTLFVSETKEDMFHSFFYNNSLTINDTEERVNQLLFTLLLDSEKIITTLSLANEHYVSKPTILKDLESCAEKLKKYDITIKFSRNNGVYIEYSEERYRLAVKNYLMQGWPVREKVNKSVQKFFKGMDFDIIRHIIQKIEKQWKVQLSEKSLMKLQIFISLIITRKDKTTQMTAKEYQMEEEFKIYNEYSFAKNLCDKISEIYKISLSPKEIKFLSQVIMSFSLLHQFDPSEGEVNNIFLPIKEYEFKITNFVNELIQTMSEILNQDFSSDRKLYYGLLGHIRPAIFRMKFRNNQSDTTISFIKKEYKDVYRATWGTTTLFEEYFSIEAVENELLYLSMYFQASIERNAKRLSILLLSKLDMSQNQYIVEKIKNNIYMVSEIDIAREYDKNSNKSYDVIMTTQQGNVDQNYIQVPLPLTNNQLPVINERLNEANSHREEEVLFRGDCHQLFDPELIFTQCNYPDKYSLLKFLTDKLERKGYVSNDFLDCVLSREAKTSTYIENGIAIPHGSTLEVNESKMCIVILDEPILWDDEMVDIIFLMALKMNSIKESEKVQQFYKSFVQLTSSERNIQKLKAQKNNIDLYKFFMR